MTRTLSVITEYFPVVLYLIIMGLISYFISLKISKRNIKLLLTIPLIFLGFTIILGVSSLITNDWGALCCLILAVLILGAFLSSLVSSLIVYFTKFKNNENKD
ncbi:MAG: hypothetical protein AB7U52_04235 [Candidatus Izemoplasmatales bacterium]